jgi:hypothetical protein
MNPKQKNPLTKIFAVSGAILLWAPILFMFLTAIVGSIMSGTLLFDYLMLAELFPLVALGLVLLVLASLLARTYRHRFGWGAVAALLALTGGQLFASASGLASGEAEPFGAVFAVVISSIIVYNVIIVALAVLAVFLVKRLFQKRPDVAD